MRAISWAGRVGFLNVAHDFSCVIILFCLILTQENLRCLSDRSDSAIAFDFMRGCPNRTSRLFYTIKIMDFILGLERKSQASIINRTSELQEVEECNFRLCFWIYPGCEVVAPLIAAMAGEGKIVEVITAAKRLGLDVINRERSGTEQFGIVTIFASKLGALPNDSMQRFRNAHSLWLS